MRALSRLAAGVGAVGLALALADGARGWAGSIALALAGAAIAAALAGISPAAIGLGALGALAYALLRPSWPILAAAVLAAMVYAARAIRARDAATTVVHLALAALAGAAAGFVVLRFASGEPMVRGVAIAVASLLVSAPFALHVEDPRVVALARLARRSRGPARIRLLRAAAIRRRAIGGSIPLAGHDRRRMERAFASIARLAEAQIEAGVIDARALDRALSAQVAALAKWTRALRLRWAAGEAISAADPREIALAGDDVAAQAAVLDELS